MPNNTYLKQAELVLRILPYIAREEVFALKGGTAINFFWRDYPRLSVDIDLTYLKIHERALSLLDISDCLASIEMRIARIFPGIKVTQQLNKEDSKIKGLIIKDEDATVKIEVNPVIRGAVFPVVNKKLCPKAEATFELTLSVNTLSFEDLYGGKICAALDRQHPRDLFDIKLLFDNEGLTEGIRKAFLVYLISHDRPMVEILDPNLLDIRQIFENEFTGMTAIEIELKELIDIRNKLIKLIKASLTEKEIEFLLSFKNKTPRWDLLGLTGIEKFPAPQWKLINLSKMNPEKHKLAFQKLEKYLLS